ncbi:hypothetical protein [Dechloromonas agitata]|uniref:hypothetical protein n=1 Tax=Dechloromonas agitata TaxID=73030 RepID=UPI001E5A2208|nr:hypothetical protein [Dechloromonas agitata]
MICIFRLLLAHRHPALFQSAGARDRGLIGEGSQDLPKNRMPFVAQAAVGRCECLKVRGNDYPAPDSGVNIHVVTLLPGT